jgi:hypothetical protein
MAQMGPLPMSTMCQLSSKDHDVVDGAARTGHETLEEGLLGEVRVVLLQVLLAGGDELDGDKLVAI